MQPQHRVQWGERLFWGVAAGLALIFVAYLIGVYRFTAPVRRQMAQARQQAREQNFGKGIPGT